MKVACPSCQALFEAEAPPAAGPGLLLCEACSLVGEAPPLPAAPEAPAVAARRRRPKVPELSFRRREPRVDVEEAEAVESEPTQLSLDDLEVISSRAAVLVHDGGFTRQERAISVFPGDPGPMSRRGAELSPDDFSSDVGPVSLRDLGIVLAPVAAPPPWSGAVDAQPGSGRVADSAAADLARMAELCPPSAPERAAPMHAIPPPPAEANGAGSRDGADSGIVDLRRLIASVEQRLASAAPPSDRAREKPSFFRVDSVPPPPRDSIPVEFDDGPPPSSGRADLLSLVALPSDRPRVRAAEDLLHLRGGLFADTPSQGPRGPLPPLDAALLAPVLSPDRLSRTSVQPPAGVAAPRSARPPRPSSAPPPAPAPARASKSGAPGPVVSERRSTPAAALWRSGVAGWAAVLLGVAGASVAVGFRLGSASPPHDDARAVASTVTTPVAVTPAERPVVQPFEPRARVDESPTAVTPASRAPTVRAVEPAAVVRERAVVPPPAPPVPSPAVVPPAPPPPVAPVVQAPPPGGGGEFDRGAAKAALAAAASAAGACKQGDDPSGGARVSVTWAPSGRVTSARILSGPFQGTPTGSCIAQTFRAASVPPFSGDAVTVAKDVSVR